jgi:hypothetical protein
MPRAMKIHETTRADGTFSPVDVRVVDGELVVESQDGACALPAGALAKVMTRYGASLEAGAKLTDVDAIDVGGGARLRHVRHLARYDVIAKDWLVYDAPGEEPICALANTVAAALVHLARVAARTPDTGS